MAWQTWDGRILENSEISHQHISNIYWMNIIFGGEDRKALSFAKQQLKIRFNGEVLPYKPDIRFRKEIDSLYFAGYIKWDHFEVWHTMRSGKIKYNGKEIGEVECYEVGKQEWETIK